MRIATWNLNHIGRRLPLLEAWLDATRPDAVALQELKVTNEAFPRAALEACGYGCLVVGQKSWNGVALLARDAEPVEVRRRLPGGTSDDQARYLEAAINGVLVASLYAPNGNPFPGPKYAYKLAWLERLVGHAAQLWKTGQPIVLAGDYNVVPTDADIYNPATWLDNALLQDEPRAAYRRLLSQGWTDTIAAHAPAEPAYTFWDYRHQRWQRNAGLRIDHLLVSQALKKQVVRVGIDQAMRALPDPSDHAPAWIELDLNR